LLFTRPELNLLVCCARVEIDLDRAECIKVLLQQNLDWEYLITTAKLHGVAPLLYTNLMKIGSEAVPKDKLEKLQKFVQTKTKRNLYLVIELIRLIELFKSHHILAIPYKGVVLAAAVYGDLSLRQFVDIDFLVPRQHYLKAQKQLMAQGYLPPAQNEVDWERSFVHPQRKVGIDLHQGLTPDYLPFHIDFQALWQRLELVSVGGTQVKSFSPEDLLIVLCVQLAKDSQWTAEVLIKICDIAEVLRVYQLNWHIVWQRCVKLGTKRILLFSLCVVYEMLEVELPDLIRQKIQADNIAQKAAAQVYQEFFQRSEQSFRERTYKERVFLRNLARERWQDKISYFFKSVVTPNEQEFSLLHLPKQLFFLYYLFRPIRLILKTLKN
jgi:hypothetical protein